MISKFNNAIFKTAEFKKLKKSKYVKEEKKLAKKPYAKNVSFSI